MNWERARTGRTRGQGDGRVGLGGLPFIVVRLDSLAGLSDGRIAIHPGRTQDRKDAIHHGKDEMALATGPLGRDWHRSDRATGLSIV